MISGKKIKMKVKKSKKDKQVISNGWCEVGNLHSVWIDGYLLLSSFFVCVCYSEIKIEQNFLSSWTPPCDATQILRQNSGDNNSAFQENNNEEFSEKEMITTCIDTQAAHGLMGRRSRVQNTFLIFIVAPSRRRILQREPVAFVMREMFVTSSVIKNDICSNSTTWRSVTAGDRLSLWFELLVPPPRTVYSTVKTFYL